jgi:hypothetical protein
MNTNSTRKIIVTASAVAICISGSWAAAPAQATTDTGGGGTTTSSASSVVEIDQIVAKRKMQMAADYVTYAAARVAYAARTR